MLDNSKNVLITGGTLTVTNVGKKGRSGMDLLQEGIAPGAFHNSSERYDPPKCHPQTRLAVIEAIMDWINDGQKTSFIMWLYGPAGAGKSAILQTIAEMCDRLGILAASFFWSRIAPGRNDETRLVASLAYQLSLAIPQIRIYVEAALEQDPSLLSRSLEVQMESLIEQPLEKTFLVNREGLVNPSTPKLIVLDGLDECGIPKAQRYILRTISAAVQKFPIPIIFLIASRPEQEIRDGFNTQPLSSVTARLALDDKYGPDADIRLFLCDRFDSLRESHSLRSLLPPAWPTEEEVDALVRKASGQFIYAATVIKFVSSPRRMPEEQLKIILGITDIGSDTPFAELDALYHHIFSLVEDLPRALEIISCLFLIRNSSESDRSLTPLTANRVEKVLFYKHGELHVILSDLHSVLDVPDIEDASRELGVFHASLQDFLMDPKRSGNFHLDKCKAHTRLTRCFLGHIHKYPGHSPPLYAMAFSCYYLVQHCLESFPTKELLSDLFDFDFKNWLSIVPSVPVAPQRNRKLITYKELVQLFMWFQKQESTFKGYFGTSMSLCAHHSHSWEMAIRSTSEAIVSDWFQTEVDRNEIAAITHPHLLRVTDLPTICEVFNSILRTRDGFYSDGFLYQIDTGGLDGHAEYLLELQKFLRDRKRAGSFFVHGGMYADLSLQIGRFVFKTSQTHRSIGYENATRISMQWAIESLPFYLANADYTSELSDYLLSHTLEADASDPNIKVLQEAIGLYLQSKSPITVKESEKNEPSPFRMKISAIAEKLRGKLKRR